jgi:2,3-dihydroxy-p-cumate/2,3-dihydroxybenzoate 3,4-dioxygenase
MWRMKKKQVPIVFGPGRHPPSGSVFLYFLEPDGMTLEYSFGMEEFPEREPTRTAAAAAGSEVDRLLGRGTGSRRSHRRAPSSG